MVPAKKILKNVLTSFRVFNFAKKSPIEQWEKKVLKLVKEPVNLLLPFIKDGDVFVDVGANVGVFSDSIMKSRNNLTVHLFEPVPKYYEWLQHKYVNRANVFINNVALSDSIGRFSLWVDSDNLGWNTMISEKKSSNMREMVIDAIIFDDYVQEKGLFKIDAIKIDVEGAEFKVLRGMRNTISRLKIKPVIICEIGWGRDSHPNWLEEVDTFEWLFNNGYQRFDYKSITKTCDVLFIPI